jgi:L-arabinose isomerase
MIWPEMRQKVEKLVEEQIIKRIKTYGDVVYPGLTTSLEETEKAREAFIREDVDIIIVSGMSYCTSDIPYAVIRDIDKPLIIFNTQVQEEIDKDVSFEAMLGGNSLVGAVELAGLMKKTKRDYIVVSGVIGKDETYEDILDYLEAAKAIKVMKSSNIGFIGNSPYTGMLDIAVDETSVKERFGINVVHMDIGEIIQVFKGISEEDIGKEKKRLKGEYKNITLSEDQFQKSVRMGLCYKELIKKYDLSSIANYCQTTMYNPEIGIAPCLGTTICTSDGVPFSCEGDIGSAIALLVLRLLAGSSVFAEPYVLDYKKNAVLLGHCGQGNLDYAKENDDVKIMPHPIFESPGGLGAGLEFYYKEGDSTILNMSADGDCNWKMVISEGKMIYGPLRIGVPAAWWKTDKELNSFIKEWCYAGPTHHMGVAYGHLKKKLEKIGQLLSLNVYLIG